MSSPAPVRQRGVKIDKKATGTPQPEEKLMNGKVEDVKEQVKEAVKSEWDFKLTLTIITILAFVTRFWGISHPDQVVFDEVHFGKGSEQTRTSLLFLEVWNLIYGTV